MDELIAAIENHPDDPAGYAVYGDWLVEQGDPLGELITMHHGYRAMRHSSRHMALDAELRAKQKAYFEQWFGAFRRSWPHWIRPYWFHGVICWLTATTGDGRELLETIWNCPGTRFLRGLELTVSQEEQRSSWADPDDTTNPIPVILERGLPRTLRRLDLTLEMIENGPFEADLAPIMPKLRDLEELAVWGPVQLGVVDLPKLQRLGANHFRSDAFAALASARLPSLTSLRLESDWSELGAFDLEHAPNLHELVVHCHLDFHLDDASKARIHAGALTVLAKAPILRRVRRVDFETSIMSDTFDTFVRLLPAFMHLEEIRISEKELEPWQHDALVGILGARVVSR